MGRPPAAGASKEIDQKEDYIAERRSIMRNWKKSIKEFPKVKELVRADFKDFFGENAGDRAF